MGQEVAEFWGVGVAGGASYMVEKDPVTWLIDTVRVGCESWKQ